MEVLKISLVHCERCRALAAWLIEAPMHGACSRATLKQSTLFLSKEDRSSVNTSARLAYVDINNHGTHILFRRKYVRNDVSIATSQPLRHEPAISRCLTRDPLDESTRVLANASVSSSSNLRLNVKGCE